MDWRDARARHARPPARHPTRVARTTGRNPGAREIEARAVGTWLPSLEHLSRHDGTGLLPQEGSTSRLWIKIARENERNAIGSDKKLYVVAPIGDL
eukprot:867260-Prymnesium_polylepis.1